jgi:hypothetical protein
VPIHSTKKSIDAHTNAPWLNIGHTRRKSDSGRGSAWNLSASPNVFSSLLLSTESTGEYCEESLTMTLGELCLLKTGIILRDSWERARVHLPRNIYISVLISNMLPNRPVQQRHRYHARVTCPSGALEGRWYSMGKDRPRIGEVRLRRSLGSLNQNQTLKVQT